ncbi:MAG TPA: hypothetical protein VHU44_07970 [Acidobacteriaceae bacterium]|jgi:hypothetical protein|nr:hypothetical protein [Acidobacteriaceae bacterium]
MSVAAVLPFLQARAEFVPILRRASRTAIRSRSHREGPLQRIQAAADPAAAAQPDSRPTPRPQLAFYRKYTEGMLRRYMRMSLELGRVPSLLGRGEMFRAKVSSYRMESFEDVVIFCHDVERCIQRLTSMQQSVIDLMAVKQYTLVEAASVLGICREVAVRHYIYGLDRLTEIFIEAEILNLQNCCQAPRAVQNPPTK